MMVPCGILEQGLILIGEADGGTVYYNGIGREDAASNGQ